VHPVIAAFLDVKTAVDTLERGVAGIPMGPDAMAFVAAARAHGDLSAFVLQAKGKEIASDDAQNATILIAVRAALARLPFDPVLGPQAKKAREALADAGADNDQVEQLLGGVLVEEAFTGDTDPDHFDTPFVHESFGELVELARLDETQVGNLMDAIAESAAPNIRPMQVACAETLFQAAWSEGPQSINVEHVEDALQMLTGDDPTELSGVKAALESVLRFLSSQKLIGPLRLERLLGHLKEWTLADEEDEEDEEDGDATSSSDDDEEDDADKTRELESPDDD
jgi:hypothetical protein